jgi:chromate transporter
VFLEFLKLGVVVFGSGYVLLAFLRRDLVTDYHWINTRQLLDAVAVGQFTPGPVFTTATFVGYLVGGTGGAVLATLGIFLPSFVMVMLLAPLVPRLRRSPWTGSALDGLNAGAVGLMAGVSVDLARSALPDALTIVVAAIALLALTRRRANAVVLIGAGAVVGLAHALL